MKTKKLNQKIQKVYLFSSHLLQDRIRICWKYPDPNPAIIWLQRTTVHQFPILPTGALVFKKSPQLLTKGGCLEFYKGIYIFFVWPSLISPPSSIYTYNDKEYWKPPVVITRGFAEAGLLYKVQGYNLRNRNCIHGAFRSWEDFAFHSAWNRIRDF